MFFTKTIPCVTEWQLKIASDLGESLAVQYGWNIEYGAGRNGGRGDFSLSLVCLAQEWTSHPFNSSSAQDWLHVKSTWEAFKKYSYLGPTLGQLNQNLWGEAQALVCFKSFPGDSNEQSCLPTTASKVSNREVMPR